MEVNTSAINGAVFITDIVPTGSGTVSGKIYEDAYVLTACQGDTNLVTVSVMALTGLSHLTPRVTVNGISISNFTLNAQMRWVGSVAIALIAPNLITVEHEDGGVYTLTMVAAVGPAVSNFRFTGSYPGSQTELKFNDPMNITFSCNSSAALVEVYDYEAAQARTQAITGTGPFTVSIAIANRGSGTVVNQKCKIRIQGSNGIWGAYALTNTYGSGERSAYVTLNNDRPSISITSILYPYLPGLGLYQKALKGSEQATVNNTITCNGAFTAQYASASELTITNPNTYETAKIVTRLGGTYNPSAANLSITATKTSNNYQAPVASVCVAIDNSNVSDAGLYFRISTPTAFRSYQPAEVGSYSVPLTCSHNLLVAPIMSDLPNNQGSWADEFTRNGSDTSWLRHMRVIDTDTKNGYTYASVTATTWSGVTVTKAFQAGWNTYRIAGFMYRILQITRLAVEVDLLTPVTNTANIRAWNGLYGSTEGSPPYNNEVFTTSVNLNDYNPDNFKHSFSITSGNQTYNPHGQFYYINDLYVASANSEGTKYKLYIEEIA